MKNIFLLTGSILAALLSSSQAEAKADPRLTEYFRGQIAAVQKTMASNPPPASAKLVDYNIDILPQVGVGVSEVFHLTLNP